jgi:hypothetical protein
MLSKIYNEHIIYIFIIIILCIFLYFQSRYNANEDITLTINPPKIPTSPKTAPTILNGCDAPLSERFQRKNNLPIKKHKPKHAAGTGYSKPPIMIKTIIDATTST